MVPAEGSQPKTLRSWVEFHDSDLNSIVVSADVVSLHVDAYVHRWEQRNGEWAGTGCMQPVTIVVRTGTAPITQFITPMEIVDGYVRVNETVYQNLVRLPFQGNGAVRVVLELSNSAVLQFAGDRVTITAVGDPRFVEELPADLRPPDLQP
jgi:hypothetical protein